MMKRFNFLVLPYRDQYFASRYGLAVRDIQIIAALADSEMVEKVTAINRPVSIYEWALGRKRRNLSANYNELEKLSWLDKFSPDLVGPLKGRAWYEKCYAEYSAELLRSCYRSDCYNVFLDFSPISVLDASHTDGYLYWYDLIDNFTKHNLYNDHCRDLVARKYAYVGKRADLITAVSDKAASLFARAQVVPNSVAISASSAPRAACGGHRPDADFGFIGFVTDKFDVDLVTRLSKLGYRINIYGQVYSQEIGAALSRIPRVKLFGRHHTGDTPRILGSFKVGLIPYRRDRLHDESPLKLYQYVNAGKPVLASTSFGLSMSALHTYTSMESDADLGVLASTLIEMSEDPAEVARTKALVSSQDFWDFKISRLLSQLQSLSEGRKVIA